MVIHGGYINISYMQSISSVVIDAQLDRETTVWSPQLRSTGDLEPFMLELTPNQIRLDSWDFTWYALATEKGYWTEGDKGWGDLGGGGWSGDGYKA
jgi:hypothetical protein